MDVPAERAALAILEVCETTGLSRSFIYEAIQRGELCARKAGRRTLILRTDLDTFLARLPRVRDRH